MFSENIEFFGLYPVMNSALHIPPLRTRPEPPSEAVDVAVRRFTGIWMS